MPRQRSALILVLGIIGIPLLSFCLTVVYPVWIAPPHQVYTFWLHMGAFFLWIGLVFYAITRVAAQRKLLPVLSALLLMIIVPCLCCSLGGYNLPMPGFIFTSFSCTQRSLGAGRVEYSCTRQTVEERSVYRLEGREGWPIVHVVDREFYP